MANTYQGWLESACGCCKGHPTYFFGPIKIEQRPFFQLDCEEYCKAHPEILSGCLFIPGKEVLAMPPIQKDPRCTKTTSLVHEMFEKMGRYL